MSILKLKKNQHHRVFVGLGSNLGERRANILKALEKLSRHRLMKLIRHTRLTETTPWGLKKQPLFINAVAEIVTDLRPISLLKELKNLEKEMGRRENTIKWGPRIIDLDILLYDDCVIREADLTIPHPRIHERDFVILQLLELEDDMIHPRLGVHLRTLLNR